MSLPFVYDYDDMRCTRVLESSVTEVYSVICTYNRDRKAFAYC